MKERLPEGECVYVRTLSGDALKYRVQILHEAGWSLAAIANAFEPPRQRSSIRAWALAPSRTPHTQPPIPLPSSPSSHSSHSHSSLIPAPGKSDPHDSASSPSHAPATPTKTKVRRRVYDPSAPRISPAHKKKIARLAPVARRYRARTNPNTRYARANAELTDLCKNLYYSGASVRELSLAAGVTYRAMARRLGR